jgi:dipeptidyl aminopeptidase/acylaminoacyl peptidase
MRNLPGAFLYVISASSGLTAQVTLADYARAAGLKERYETLTTNVAEVPEWIGKSDRFIYRKSVPGGHAFVVVDAATLSKAPTFDHARLAESLSKMSGKRYTAETLPFAKVHFADDGKTIEYTAANSEWKTTLSDYTTVRAGPAKIPNFGVGEQPRGPVSATFNKPVASPDGKSEALIRNYNVWLRLNGSSDAVPLSMDGSEGNYYERASITWSPDSKKVAAYRIRPGMHRTIQFEDSSPADQIQPRYFSLEYAKPGDVLDLQQPVLFDVAERKQTRIENGLFPNPFELSKPVWRDDSRAFTFEYNERGHQVYRIIEVDGTTGRPRAVVSEQAKTFFCYSGKMFRHDIADGKEVIWMSERDGWNHLYLYDGVTGEVKNQITKGEWVVRGVDHTDDKQRQVWFHASGMYPREDPYYTYYYRINYDGSGLIRLTPALGNHTVTYSEDMQYYSDLWSRVDDPPALELRRTTDGAKIMDLERGDITPLLGSGWKAAEPFKALGRDGRTEIWGVIIRPSNFDPSRRYPVIENIYAGPHDSFVPKSFFVYNPMQSLAELGFVVVQIDGMGTSNRSKAFHDVCWKNLQDAGFPDRILWHKAVAAKYPWYDLTRVGIYGHSAGGQNAMGALLFHPEFYKVAVASSGCHDNRMDKIWWNEQWMGWPIGSQYAAASNVDNAYRLKGKLLLTAGELDDNVDPASTLQAVHALMKANKVFDLLIMPGAKHTPGGEYGIRKRNDFFVRHLLGVEPPDWNTMDLPRLEDNFEQALN